MKITGKPETFDEYPGTGHWLLASCCWLLVTKSKILEMHRGIGSLGADKRKLVTQI